MQWVLIRSWHAVANPSRSPGRWVTRCGKVAYSDPVDVLPGAKSCESCLRIVARQEDRLQAVAAPDGDRLTL